MDSCRSCFSDAGLEEMVLPPASCWHFWSPSEFLSHVGAAGTAGLLADYENGREALGRRLSDLH